MTIVHSPLRRKQSHLPSASRTVSPRARFIANSETACSNATRRLAEADIARSGMSLKNAKAEGIFATDDASAINPDFAAAPALILPYYDSRGQSLTYTYDGLTLPFCRARYLVPVGFPLPRGHKYDQPRDSGTPPYFPRSYEWHRVDQDGVDEICCVEGEKKAAALCRAGIPTIAIGGVWNFTDGDMSLHPALAAIADKCRVIYICFDSDAATNPDIQLAEWRLSGQLALLGVRVHAVRIPHDGGSKVGADDYLVKHGSNALIRLIQDTPALGEVVAQASADEITVADALRREVEPVEELIPGLIEKGIPVFIAGAGGSHKSRIAMQWGLCINAGAAIWGLAAAPEGLRGEKATLVFCAAEDDANELARRAQAICSELKLNTPPQGVFIARKGKSSALAIMHEDGRAELCPFYHWLVQRLKTIQGHKLVVLDSAYDFVRFAGRAKIVEDTVNHFIKVVLQSICDQTDSTLLIPWHPSQAGSSRDTMDGWSVAWHNAARMRLAISEVKDTEDTYELRVVKRNHGPKGQPFNLKFHNGVLLPVEALPDDGKKSALRKVCVKAAIEAAGHNVPLNRVKRPPNLVFKEAENVLGRRPSLSDVRNALEEAARLNELAYISHTRHRAAGYYPPDAEEAKELALAAKKAARSSEDA